MNASIENLLKDTSERHPEFLHCFHRSEIPCKKRLLDEGTVSQWIYFVLNGALRAWTDRDGEDITVQFFFEGQAVSSFMGQEPSMFSIESIEPSTVIGIRIDDFRQLLDTMPEYKDMMLEIIIGRLRYYSSLFISRIKFSPEQRYIELCQHNPELLQRVAQHYIASYLGITPVSLSRIRNRLKG